MCVCVCERERERESAHHFGGAGEVLLSAVVEAAHVALELSAGPDAHVEHAEVGAAEIESEIVALHVARRESREGEESSERSKEEEREEGKEKRRGEVR